MYDIKTLKFTSQLFNFLFESMLIKIRENSFKIALKVILKVKLIA